MSDKPTFRFTVLGRYPARLKGNEAQVTVNLVAGRKGHLAYSGTLTMSEDEWSAFVEALRKGLGQGVEVDDSPIEDVV